jgi:hypothetical protein
MPYGIVLSDSITDSSGGVLAPSSSVFRNRLINSDMRIDQRNAGASVTPTSGQYTLDRWVAGISQSSKFSVQQNAASVTPPVGFTNYLGVTSLSAYSITSGDIFLMRQSIEGLNIADLAWGTASAATVTLSFWVRSSLTGTFGGTLTNSAENRSYPFTYTINSANTWEKETITIAGDTSGTWLTTNGAGIKLNFSLGMGSTYSGTAGAWTGTANIFSATGAVSVVGTNGATFYITGVQLEKGSTATSFEYLDYGRSLIQCQRYYERMGGDAVGDIWGFSYASGASVTFAQTIYYKATKRAIPTATKVGTWTVTNCGQPSMATTIGTNSSGIYAVSSALGNCQYYTASSSTYLTFDAEL